MAVARLYFAIEAARTADASLIVQFVGVDGAEGVSTIAAGYLRQALRSAGGAALLVRCAPAPLGTGADRRTPPGLVELLRQGRPLTEAVAPLDTDATGQAAGPWAVLGQDGEHDADPRTLAALAASLRQSFSLIVLDCPPVARSPLAGALARIADGTIIVVGAGRTRRRALERAVGEVVGLGGQVVGLVLNRHRDWLPGWLRRHAG